MERSAQAADVETFRRAAHSLKSSAASLGGVRVEALSARLEALAPGPAALREAAALLPVLRDECAALFAALGLEAPEERIGLPDGAGDPGRA